MPKADSGVTSPDALAQTIRSTLGEVAHRGNRAIGEAALDSLLALLAERERERDEARRYMSQREAKLEEKLDVTQAERDAAVREAATLREALEPIADGPCRIFPHPPPTRDQDDRFVWPNNCITQKQSDPCDKCRARAALAAAAPAETAR